MLALALQYGAQGDIKGAVKHGNPLALAYSPISNIVRGNKVRNAYLKAAITDPELTKYVDAIVQGGGRVTMDEQYRANMKKQFLDACRRNAVGTAAWLSLPALAEAAMWPILEWLVPRQKLGIFADMVDFELKRLGPDATQEQVRKAFAGAWDSVDNRMGQMVYDNLFWDRTAKDLAMITVQSVGWNMGTLREFYGAAKDTIKAGGNIARRGPFVMSGAGGIPGGTIHGGGSGSGRISGGGPGGPVQPPNLTGSAQPDSPWFTRRMGYAVATTVMTALVGAFIDYVNTKGRRKRDGTIDDGHDRDIRDYFFPRTGNVDEQGHEERIALWGYLKDLVGWYMEPANSARGKLSPIVRVVAETLSNRRYDDTKIWDTENNTPVENVMAELTHKAGYFLPISVAGILRERDRGAGAMMQVAQEIGIRTAPSYIGRTPAERYMAEYNATAGHHSAPAPHAKIEREIVLAIRSGNTKKAAKIVDEAMAAGTITDDEVEAAMKKADADPLVTAFSPLPLSNAIEAVRLMNPEERKRGMVLLDDKLERQLEKLPRVEQDRIQEKLKRANLN